MTQEKDKYLKILKLELEHLKVDVSGLINYEKQLHEDNKHTNFVYLENLVVLKDEIMGINGILGEVDSLFPTLDNNNYVIEFEISLEKFIIKRGYPLAVFDLIKGKINKIEQMKNLF